MNDWECITAHAVQQMKMIQIYCEDGAFLVGSILVWNVKAGKLSIDHQCRDLTSMESITRTL